MLLPDMFLADFSSRETATIRECDHALREAPEFTTGRSGASIRIEQ